MKRNFKIKRSTARKIVRTFKRVKWHNVLKLTAVLGVAVAIFSFAKMTIASIERPFKDPAVQVTYKMSEKSDMTEPIDYEYQKYIVRKREEDFQATLKNKADTIAVSKFTDYTLCVGNMKDISNIIEVYAPYDCMGSDVQIYNATDEAGLGNYIGTYPCVGINNKGVRLVVNDKETYDKLAETLKNHIYINVGD